MKRMVSACPGSCGEWLQGWMLEGEKLISYAIDSFSRVTLEESTHPADGHQWLKLHRPRAWQMMDLIFKEAGVPSKEQQSFQLKLESPLPLAKGMASSTADLAAVGDAVARWFGLELSPQQLTQLCAQLEPTDSIIFPQLCLMDPLTGKVSLSFQAGIPSLNLLVLEGKKGVLTEDSRKKDHFLKRKAYAGEMEKALNIFQQGLTEKRPPLLAQAAWISALGNEAFYPQAGLQEIQKLAQHCGGLGINVSHSGSTIGVLYEPGQLDEEKFLKAWETLSCRHHYKPPQKHRMISGGIRREE